MNMTESILNYRQYLKRKNYSELTVKNYLHRLKLFFSWLPVTVEAASATEVKHYIDYLLEKRMAPHSINCHLSAVRGFYDYLASEEGIQLDNPVARGQMLREPHPLPRYLHDNELQLFLKSVSSTRDLAIFMLMLRCGLRVQEVVNLTLDVIDYRRSRILVKAGKGARDRIVYISNDAAVALAKYLRKRPKTGEKQIFLAEKGRCRGKPISVRAVQKRVEHYAQESGVAVTCHRFRHTMATQLLNADADLVTIQELLGHSKIKTTQRYSKLLNLKAQRDYFKAMEVVMRQTSTNQRE
ncbi:MAG: tyrosine-type recombinase/integrase [Pseudomonadota bacterium]